MTNIFRILRTQTKYFMKCNTYRITFNLFVFVLYLKINCTSKNTTISFVSNIAIRPATFFLHHLEYSFYDLIETLRQIIIIH